MLLSCSVTHIFFSPFPTPAHLPLEAYPCYVFNFMCKRRVPRRKEKHLWKSNWSPSSSTGVERSESMVQPWIENNAIASRAHKIFILFVFRSMNRLWWINQVGGVLFLSFMDLFITAGVFIWRVRRDDRKWLNAIGQENCKDTSEIKFQPKSIRLSLISAL